MPSKTCTKCGQSKEPTLFSKSTQTRDRLTSWCKVCCAAAVKAKYRADRGLTDEAVRASRLANIARATAAAVAKGATPPGHRKCKKCLLPHLHAAFPGPKSYVCQHCVGVRRKQTAAKAAEAQTQRLLRNKQKRAAARAALPPPPPYVPPAEKACTKCAAVKPLLDFERHSQTRDGRNSWCRPCRQALNAARVKTRRAADPVFRATDPRIAERDAQRAAQAALKADHRAHVDARQRWLGDCRAHVQAWRDWKAAQPRRGHKAPTYERAKSAFRRARRLGRLAPWCTIGDTLPFYERAAELEQATGVDWNVDHRVPLRAVLASGLHCPANLQVLPRAVNEGKTNYFSPEHA